MSQIAACGQKQVWAFGPYWSNEVDARVEEVFSSFPGSTVWVQFIPDAEAKLVTSLFDYTFWRDALMGPQDTEH
jgi:hypothetical protein